MGASVLCDFLLNQISYVQINKVNIGSQSRYGSTVY